MENVKKFNFVEDFKNVGLEDFNDYDFKKDYLLSIRLSYGEEKQNSIIFKDYTKFLKDLKIINEDNATMGDYKKSSSYYFVFKKLSDFNDYFDNLQKFYDTLKEDTKQKAIIKSLLECKEDLQNINFTIANFEEKRDKIKNFINFCKSKNLIK